MTNHQKDVDSSSINQTQRSNRCTDETWLDWQELSGSSVTSTKNRRERHQAGWCQLLLGWPYEIFFAWEKYKKYKVYFFKIYIIAHRWRESCVLLLLLVLLLYIYVIVVHVYCHVSPKVAVQSMCDMVLRFRTQAPWLNKHKWSPHSFATCQGRFFFSAVVEEPTAFVTWTWTSPQQWRLSLRLIAAVFHSSFFGEVIKADCWSPQMVQMLHGSGVCWCESITKLIWKD